MWRASSNTELTLTGEFRNLWIAVIKQLREDVAEHASGADYLNAIYDDREEEQDAHWLFIYDWNSAFNALPNRDKIVLLADITKALLDSSVPQPELTQLNESAVYAVFEALADLITIEIDQARDMPQNFKYTYRTLVAAAERELFGDELAPDEFIKIKNTNADEWRGVIESLADIILWDRDFEEHGTGKIADMPPDKANALKTFLGIRADYFTGTVPLVTREQFMAALAYMKNLV